MQETLTYFFWASPACVTKKKKKKNAEINLEAAIDDDGIELKRPVLPSTHPPTILVPSNTYKAEKWGRCLAQRAKRR